MRGLARGVKTGSDCLIFTWCDTENTESAVGAMRRDVILAHSTVGHDWTPGRKVEDIQAERLKQLGHDGAS